MIERHEVRSMRGHPVDEMQAVDLGVVEDVLGRPWVALLRIAALRPRATCPVGLDLGPLARLQQAAANAQEPITQGLTPLRAQPGEGLARWPREVDPGGVVARRGLSHGVPC